MGEAPSPAYVSDFLATSDGLSLTKAFMRIKSSKLRRRIVDLVEQIAGDGVSVSARSHRHRDTAHRCPHLDLLRRHCKNHPRSTRP